MKTLRTCVLLLVVGLMVAQAQHDADTLQLAAVGGDKTALAQLRTLADKGDFHAQSDLGFMYYTGSGVLKDFVQAVNWYRKAAEQGDSYAQGSLGQMYGNGDGVPKDAVKASSWYRKAAEGGNPSAQNVLSRMYASGDGVLKDFVIAYMWSNLAAAAAPRGSAGGEIAKEARDALEKQMTPAQIAEAQRLSREWRRRK